jgi:hypothetical protein
MEGGEAPAAAAGTAPKPSLRIPMPSRSTSAPLPLGLAIVEVVPLLTIFDGPISVAFLIFSASCLAFSSSSSRCLSYPSCLIRSASSAARRSASAKSTGAALLTPPRPPNLVFFGPAEVLGEVVELDEFRRLTPPSVRPLPPGAALDRIDEDVTVRG